MSRALNSTGIARHPLVRPFYSTGLWYYVFVGSAGVLGLFKAVLAARILGSEAFGYYAFAVLFASFADYLLHFGLYRGLEAILPRLYGAGNVAEAQRLRNSVAGCILILAAAFLFVTGVCGVCVSALSSVRSIVGLAGGLSVAMLFFGLGCQDLRSQGQITLSASLIFVRSIAGVTVGLFSAMAFSFAGLLLADLLVCLILFVIQARFLCAGFRFDFGGFAELQRVFKIGVPLVLRNLANDLALSLDRWCVTLLFGFVVFGQYTFAMILASVGMIIYSAIWNDVGPQATRAFGQSRDIQSLLCTFHKNTALISGSFVILWLPFAYLTTRLLPGYFPEYTTGIALLPVIFWGVLFQILCQYDWVAMALQRTTGLLCVTVIVFSIVAPFYAAAILLGWPLASFAWIFVAGRALTACGQFLLALSLSGRLRSGICPLASASKPKETVHEA